MSRDRRKKRTYKRGDVLTLLIGANTSDELLEWLNSRDYYGPAIFQVLEKYVKNELVSAEYLKSLFEIEIRPRKSNHDVSLVSPSVVNEEESYVNKQGDEDKKEDATVIKTDNNDAAPVKAANNKKKRIMPSFSVNVKSIIDED